jgi:diguanylate cyclase (GGDEF)-like protein
MLILEGVPELPGLEEAAGGALHRAGSPLGAATALARHRPRVLVIHGGIGWHRLFVAALTPQMRPAVVVYGGERGVVAADWADEWLASPPSALEARHRLRLAVERARARRLNSRRVFVDPLTGLPNRRAAVRALVREAERTRRGGGVLSLVLIDLDDFKRVNEEEGHDAGDRLLRRVGAALAQATRGDELCARIGGDEFALVICGDLIDAQRAEQRVRERLRVIGVSATSASCSLEGGERLHALYRRTDAVLRARKELRRSHAVARRDELSMTRLQLREVQARRVPPVA